MSQIDQLTIKDAEEDFSKGQCRCKPKGFYPEQFLDCAEYVCDNSGVCICDCHVDPQELPELIKQRELQRERFLNQKLNPIKLNSWFAKVRSYFFLD